MTEFTVKINERTPGQLEIVVDGDFRAASGAEGAATTELVHIIKDYFLTIRDKQTPEAQKNFRMFETVRADKPPGIVLDQAFAVFLSHYFPQGTGADQLKELKNSFYGGAFGLLTLMQRAEAMLDDTMKGEFMATVQGELDRWTERGT